MKKTTKHTQIVIIPVLFVVLLVALTVVERGAEGTHIRTFFDSLWYMVVTLSTVGYGDLYPVTVAGRLIGLLLILMSAGLFALLVGAMVSILTGMALPGLRLLLSFKRPVFWFSERNPSTVTLASKIKEEQPSALFFFKKEIDFSNTAKKRPFTAFFMKEDDAENYSEALDFIKRVPEAEVYFRSSLAVEGLPKGMYVFHPEESTARAYWETYPLCKPDSRVVLIGGGESAHALLEQALYVNVLSPGQSIRYDIFFPDTRFRDLHYRLEDAFDVITGEDEGKENVPGKDLLVFHTVSFEKKRGILENADRIILCATGRNDSMKDLHTIRSYFPVRGDLHVLSDIAIPGVKSFGSLDEIMSPDRVMRMRDKKTARHLHRIYENTFGTEHVSFSSLPPFTQRSNLAAADHLAVKLRLLHQTKDRVPVTRENCAAAYQAFLALNEEEKTVCRKIEHTRWCRFHTVNNWRYAPERNNELRLHPALVPFDELSLREQEKDDISWEVIGKLYDPEEENE